MSFYDEISAVAKSKEQVAADERRKAKEKLEQELLQAEALALSTFKQIKQDLIRAARTDGVDIRNGHRFVSCITVVPVDYKGFLQMESEVFEEPIRRKSLYVGTHFPQGQRIPRPPYIGKLKRKRYTVSLKRGIPFDHYDEILRQYTDGEGITFSYWLEKKEPITKERRIVQLPYSEEPALNNLSLLQFSLALSCRYEFPEKEE